MLLSCFILALSVSIDSFGIGITYGLKNTKISTFAKIILFGLSIIITLLSILLGDMLSYVLSTTFSKLIGCILLILMGIWVIYQSLKKKKENMEKSISSKKKVYQFMVKFLGITIQIIRNPISSDQDNSNNIDWKEAFYLGIALSIDSICVGIGSSMLGFGSIIFPILVATFQLIFLSLGKEIGFKLAYASSIPDSIWNIVSGILLICIGISRFFIG